MTNMCRAAILALALAAFGSLAAQAQNNTAYGEGALASDTTGAYNAAFGYQALHLNTTGFHNTAAGPLALFANTTGSYNAAFGEYALSANASGHDNAACGASALFANTTGYDNTASGAAALYSNATGYANTASGIQALYSNTVGYDNMASGAYALRANTTGTANTASGYFALYSNTTGNYNTAVGAWAGYYNNGGSWNIDIGSYGSASDNGVIRIGQSGNQSSVYMAGVSGVAISGPVPVYINSNGQLGTVNSSIRFKEDVHDMADASSGLLRLRPVTYRYKEPYADGSKPIDYGLVAEEVAEVYPDMVVKDADGQVQTVQYQKLTPMLLNELQKQEQTIRRLEKRLAALEAALPKQ